ncbi:MAG: hypothetical protein ACKO5K_08935 [Armatimonadota bacterium]
MAKRGGNRIVSYIPVLVIVAGVVAAAFYQEQLTAFFTLRLWDKSAPTRAVADFLTAVKSGDRAKADALVGDDSLKPLEEGGKWIGYFTVSMAGTLDYKASQIVGEPIAPSEPEFSTMGSGSALVTAKDVDGKEIPYRLEIRDGAWKVTEIRGGVPRAGSGMPAPKATKPKAPAVPGAKSAPKGK